MEVVHRAAGVPDAPVGVGGMARPPLAMHAHERCWRARQGNRRPRRKARSELEQWVGQEGRTEEQERSTWKLGWWPWRAARAAERERELRAEREQGRARSRVRTCPLLKPGTAGRAAWAARGRTWARQRHNRARTNTIEEEITV
jgi:hypothetical protein